MKKIYIDYSGSFVKTTATFAWIFLILGIISAYLIVAETEETTIALVSFLGSFLLFLILMTSSKLLKHVYYIRKISEARAEEDGFEISEEENN